MLPVLQCSTDKPAGRKTNSDNVCESRAALAPQQKWVLGKIGVYLQNHVNTAHGCSYSNINKCCWQFKVLLIWNFFRRQEAPQPLRRTKEENILKKCICALVRLSWSCGLVFLTTLCNKKRRYSYSFFLDERLG